MNSKTIRESVDKYYTEKIKSFGPVPKGVDWNGPESQTMRFDQLTRIIDNPASDCSLLDYGCGYGALLDYLNNRNLNVRYTGYDISKEMVEAAIKMHASSGMTWTADANGLHQYDYVIASGIFNVRGQIPDGDWLQYIFETLNHMNKLSVKGFAFNILTDYSDEDKKKSNLYYAKPAQLFDFCKSNFAKCVALLHDYPLYEFTILVRKNVL